MLPGHISAGVLPSGLSWLLLASLLLLPSGACAAPDGCAASEEPASNLDATGTTNLGAPHWGDGFVVWESARGGDWRIWMRRLDGSGLRQLTPDEPPSGGAVSPATPPQHCCAHLSPSGKRLVYLSRDVPRERFPRREVAGTLYLLELGTEEATSPRVLATDARTYGRGYRAAVWRGEEELIYIDASGRTLLLDVEKQLLGREDASRVLIDRQDDELAWLTDPTLRYATTGVPSFSLLQPPGGEASTADVRLPIGERPEARLQVAERRELGGCEPYFSGDGRWGVWVHGAGGPLRAMNLETRELTTLLRKFDSRLPAQGYTYFPMLSRDARLLAFGASAGGHDHYAEDYDIFVAPVDPVTLRLLAEPVRFTQHLGSDRYPDVHLAPPPAGESYADVWTRPAPAVDRSAGETVVTEEASGWLPMGSSDRRDLLLLWQTDGAPNLVELRPVAAVEERGTAVESSVNLNRNDLARFDRQGRMELAGGRFTVDPAWAEQVLAGARSRNEISVEFTAEPLPDEQRAVTQPDRREPGVLLRLGRGGEVKLEVHQRGKQLAVRMQTGPDLQTLPLVELPPGRTSHVVVTYTPGRLRAYLDGAPVLDSDTLQRDFFRWRVPENAAGWLEFGPWPGRLEGVALYGRILDADEVQAHADAYAALRARRPEVEARRVTARLVAKSETPTLDEIAPYNEALAVYEYRASDSGETLRVAHWVILDDEVLPITDLQPGVEVELVLEPYSAQPQLEQFVLSETLEPRYDLDLWFAL